MNNFVDDRGYSIFNMFPLEKGQINYSEMDFGPVKAFHRHKNQIDYWICISGKMMVNLVDDDGNVTRKILSAQKPEVIEIKPGTWHGYRTLGDKPATLLYFCTNKYDPNKPDEERCDWNKWGAKIWALENK